MDTYEVFVSSLSRPEAFPERVEAPIQRIQTHASVVLLAGGLVYKLKKPKNFGFFDYTTAPQRRHFCLEEVRLNARMAPQVYLGVAPVLQSPEGRPHFGATFAGEDLPQPGTLVQGESVVDFAVVMTRLADEATLEARVRDHTAEAPLLATIASRVAEFHQRIQTSERISQYGKLETVGGNWEENFQQMRPYIGRALDAEAFDAIYEYVHEFIRQREQFFAARIRDGHIRDCHGDLRLQHIYCLDRSQAASTVAPTAAGTGRFTVEIIDCIEFNERFRFGDVAGEIAFLTMELDEAGRPDLARAFADAYVAASGDEGLLELLPFYSCYRACVRGKVLAFQLDEAEIPAEQKEAAQKHAQALFTLAAGYTRYPTAPTLLIVGGTMGVGKSTLAASLGHRLGWKVLSSDVVRKRLAGVAPTEPHDDAYGTGLYTIAWTGRTYSTLRQEALMVLHDARSVILDASFARREERLETTRLAAEIGARAVFAECRCSREVAMRRLAERWRTRQDASDGRPELLDSQAAAWEPVTSQEAESTQHLIIHTDGPSEAAEEQVLEHLLVRTRH